MKYNSSWRLSIVMNVCVRPFRFLPSQPNRLFNSKKQMEYLWCLPCFLSLLSVRPSNTTFFIIWTGLSKLAQRQFHYPGFSYSEFSLVEQDNTVLRSTSTYLQAGLARCEDEKAVSTLLSPSLSMKTKPKTSAEVAAKTKHKKPKQQQQQLSHDGEGVRWSWWLTVVGEYSSTSRYCYNSSSNNKVKSTMTTTTTTRNVASCPSKSFPCSIIPQICISNHTLDYSHPPTHPTYSPRRHNVDTAKHTRPCPWSTLAIRSFVLLIHPWSNLVRKGRSTRFSHPSFSRVCQTYRYTQMCRTKTQTTLVYPNPKVSHPHLPSHPSISLLTPCLLARACNIILSSHPTIVIFRWTFTS
jgi:hypothetical protein